MALLAGFRVLQLGNGLGAAVAGRALADLGAEVRCAGAEHATPLSAFLNHAKQVVAGPLTPEVLGDLAAGAALIITEGRPLELRNHGHDPERLRRLNGHAVLVQISPHGQSGQAANWPASDLTLFASSGIARMCSTARSTI